MMQTTASLMGWELFIIDRRRLMWPRRCLARGRCTGARPRALRWLDGPRKHEARGPRPASGLIMIISLEGANFSTCLPAQLKTTTTTGCAFHLRLLN